MTESLRLYFVVQALGFADVSLGLSGAVFVALIGSLLTAVPLSPAGLGIVEAGVIGVLHVAYGVPLPEATAIALLDRVISVFSVIVLRLDRLPRVAASRVARDASRSPTGSSQRPCPPSRDRRRAARRAAPLQGLCNATRRAVVIQAVRMGRTFVMGAHRRHDLAAPPSTAPHSPASLGPACGVTGTNG